MKKLPLLFFCLLLLLPDSYSRNAIERNASYHKAYHSNTVLKFFFAESGVDEEEADVLMKVSSVIYEISHAVIFERHSLHLLPPGVEKSTCLLFLFNLTLRI